MQQDKNRIGLKKSDNEIRTNNENKMTLPLTKESFGEFMASKNWTIA